MNNRIGALALVLGFVFAAYAPSALAGITSISSASGLQADGTVDWGDLGGVTSVGSYNPNQISNPTPAVNVNGPGMPLSPVITVTASNPGGSTNYFSRKVGALASNATGSFNGNFAVGENLLATKNISSTNNGGPITLLFSGDVMGVGAYIMSSSLGNFDGTIKAYDVGGTLITDATYTALGNGNNNVGTALFIGLLSTSRNIRSVSFDVLGQVADGYAAYPVISGPIVQYNARSTEPSVVPLPPAAWMGLGTLAGLAFLRTRRRRELASL